ncbi:uncharacterized protein [Pyrus communis]|uniref:uncharacterized protein n=1 Tax=Pyrus communis TaxID=23211 RepID=UPI0035C26237
MADEHSEEESIITSPSTHISEMDINPNQRLSSVLLNEFNYLPWARAVSLALGGRSKLGFIDGSFPALGVTSPEYGGWLCKDQLVMSWLLNSMERKIAEIFSYSESSLTLWTTVKEMYSNQNNYARIFQLKKDISSVQQEGKTFVQHLGSLRSMWNELDVYRPHTTDPMVLLKRTEEYKIFQLLSSLSSDYEDLRSHILINPELPSFTSICATIQREEVRRKVMNNGTKTIVTEARAYLTNEKRYKGKNPHLKCLHCDNIGHVRDKCWILHPELKPDFMKDKTMQKTSRAHPRANTSSSSSFNSSDPYKQFTANPATLINEFAAYLHQKKGREDRAAEHEDGSTSALLGKFAGFLADADRSPQQGMKGIMNAFKTALKMNELHDFWVVDSGATDHMTNQVSKLHKFEKLHKPSHVSVTNGEGARIVGKGKIHLISDQIESMALYVPSFPFQLLSVGKITNSLNCLAIFSPENVIFQDLVTKRKIGEGFYLDGLYYISKSSPSGLQAKSIPGPTSESFDGYKYFITFVDDYSRATCSSEGENYLELFPLPRTEILATEVPDAMGPVHHTNIPTEKDNQASSNDTNNSESIHSIAPEESFYELQSTAPRRNPTRERHPPARLQDFVTYKPRHPLSHYVSYHKMSPKHTDFMCTISEHVEPQSFQEANQSPVWQQTMQDELHALDQHKTWSIETLPKGKKTVGCRWIYKVKFNSDGSIERHKAILVARGFTQTFDVDYKETFAPVAKMNSVRVLLSVAVNKGWLMFQMDVKNAFLHGELEEEVFMRLPPGHPQSHEPDLVCRLHKSIYGLK